MPYVSIIDFSLNSVKLMLMYVKVIYFYYHRVFYQRTDLSILLQMTFWLLFPHPPPPLGEEMQRTSILFFVQLGTLLQGTHPEGNCWVVEYLYLPEISKWPKLLNAFDPPPSGHQSLSLFTNPHFHQSWHSPFFFFFSLFCVKQYIVAFDLHT